MYINDILVYDYPFLDTCWYFVSKTDELISEKILISPSPASEFINISDPDQIIEQVFFYDLTGKVFHSAYMAQIVISQLTPGHYIVRIDLKDGQRIYRRFIKI